MTHADATLQQQLILSSRLLPIAGILVLYRDGTLSVLAINPQARALLKPAPLPLPQPFHLVFPILTQHPELTIKLNQFRQAASGVQELVLLSQVKPGESRTVHEITLTKQDEGHLFITLRDVTQTVFQQHLLNFTKQHIELLSSLTVMTKNNVSIETVFAHVCNELTRIHRLHFCDIWLRDASDKQKNTIVASYSNIDRKLLATLERAGGVKLMGQRAEIYDGCMYEEVYTRGLTKQMRADAVAQLVMDMAASQRKKVPNVAEWIVQAGEGHTVMLVPIKGSAGIIGHMGFNSKREFSAADISTLELIVDKLGSIIEINRSSQQHQALTAQLQQSQKMEAIAQLAGGIAHDFNNILTSIIGNIQLTQSVLQRPELDPSGKAEVIEMLDEVEDASNKAAHLIQQLLAYSRKQLIHPEEIDLCRQVKRVATMVRRTVGEHIQLQARFKQDALWVKADPVQMEQILLNLTVNARDAILDAGTIAITVQASGAPNHIQTNLKMEDQYVLLTVQDDGMGMSNDTQQHVFEPFFTTKEIGKGTGLGLSMVYGIVKQHKGFVDVVSREGKGTKFSIYLPRVRKPAARLTTSKQQAILQGGHETILLVEDDHLVRHTTKKMLSKLGYHVITADSGNDALVQLNRLKTPISLLLTDVIMPKMNGYELSLRILEQYPETKVIFISGYSHNHLAEQNIIKKEVILLPKPYATSELTHIIRSVLDKK